VASAGRMPATIDLVVYAGDTFRETFVVTSEGSPVDLSDYTFLAQVKADRNDANPLKTFSVDDGDAETGQIVLTMSGTDTAALVVGDIESFTGVWDFQTTDGDGIVRTWFGGAITVSLDVSRPV